MTEKIEEQVAALLRQHGLTIATAEATGCGLISFLLTEVPGSSRYFRGSVSPYGTGTKSRALGLDEEVVRRSGSVSREVAEAMAQGVRTLMEADIGLSETGMAGPTGGTPEHPVGLCWLALATGEGVISKEVVFQGDRHQNRQQMARAALSMVKEYLERG